MSHLAANFKRAFALTSLLWLTGVAAPKHVVLISVDGLGAELLKNSSMPKILEIAALGESAKIASTTRPVATIPGHVSMASGVTPEIHKSVWNENDEKLIPVDVPTIFDLLKDNKQTSVFITGKSKLKKVFEKHPPTETVLPHFFPFGDTYGRIPRVVDNEAAAALLKKPNLLFIHYALADTVGHGFGWGSMLQSNVLKAIDKSIGRVFEASKKTYGENGFVMIITADHGGHEASHGRTNADGSLQDAKHDLYIPWIVYGAKFQTEDFKTGKSEVNIIDTAPSVAHVLGLPVPASWKWQGKNILEAK